MKRAVFLADGRQRALDGRGAFASAVLCGFLASALLAVVGMGRAAQEDSHVTKAVSYQNDKLPEGPWSVHVMKIDRTNSDYEIHTVLANGTVQGMTTLSDQVKALRPALGRPIAAINGDFYHTSPKAYYGDPQGLQICDGELISGPTDHPCFWIDVGGKPQTALVQSLFRVTWPGGSTTPFGLNEDRPGDGAVLYTPMMGQSTGTKSGGREIILEAVDKQAWLPLQIGAKVQGKVVEIRDAGDTSLKPGTMVISLGPQLMVDAPILKPGDLVQISTATTPDLAGSQTAIGGGPRLVADGKVVEGWKSPNQRHPRTAIGWNDQYLYFVLVDGRQPGLSVGMSYVELAAYFKKLGCTYALNLDGGGSASMWVFGHVVSSPSEGQERPVANGLVLVKKPKKNGN
jgi:exopolysaccharide biosynthesis protein